MSTPVSSDTTPRSLQNGGWDAYTVETFNHKWELLRHCKVYELPPPDFQARVLAPEEVQARRVTGGRLPPAEDEDAAPGEAGEARTVWEVGLWCPAPDNKGPCGKGCERWPTCAVCGGHEGQRDRAGRREQQEGRRAGSVPGGPQRIRHWLLGCTCRRDL